MSTNISARKIRTQKETFVSEERKEPFNFHDTMELLYLILLPSCLLSVIGPRKTGLHATFAHSKARFMKLIASLLSGGWFRLSIKEQGRKRTPSPINAFHSGSTPVSLSFSLPFWKQHSCAQKLVRRARFDDRRAILVERVITCHPESEKINLSSLC